jgi:hypothetical protein
VEAALEGVNLADYVGCRRDGVSHSQALNECDSDAAAGWGRRSRGARGALS